MGPGAEVIRSNKNKKENLNGDVDNSGVSLVVRVDGVEKPCTETHPLERGEHKLDEGATLHITLQHPPPTSHPKDKTTHKYFFKYHLGNPWPLLVDLPAIGVVLVHGAVPHGVVSCQSTNLHLND